MKESSYEAYCFTLRKMPSEELYEQYLLDLEVMKQQSQKITSTEKMHVEARKIWSDVISEIHNKNEAMTIAKNVKNQVKQRLQSKGNSDSEELYNRCILFVQNNSKLIVSFGSGNRGGMDFLKTGLTDFQLLNPYDFPKYPYNSFYQKHREDSEIAMADAFCSSDLQRAFKKNLHSRPRYGGIRFINDDIKGMNWYGSSFLVLNDTVKLNSLFFSSDSLAAYTINKKPAIPCTFHNLEFFLLQCEDTVLDAIVAAANGNTFDAKALDREFEVMLPAINFFDFNMVEAIYIDSSLYQVPQDQIEIIQQRGIYIVNEPQPKLQLQKHSEGVVECRTKYATQGDCDTDMPASSHGNEQVSGDEPQPVCPGIEQSSPSKSSSLLQREIKNDLNTLRTRDSPAGTPDNCSKKQIR